MADKDYLNIGNDVYEEIPKHATVASRVIADMHKQLGEPDTPLSDAGEKMMNILIAIWEDMYGDDVAQWTASRKEYQGAEMTTREQIKHKTGASLASVPFPIYQMMKKVFPQYKLSSRDDWMKFLQRYPMFSLSKARKPREKKSKLFTI